MLVGLKRLDTVSIRSLGLNESWLQQQISSDPTLLGLGQLEVINREVRQPIGGRIDFLLYDAEETFYEVEVMLGALDESHIIRKQSSIGISSDKDALTITTGRS